MKKQNYLTQYTAKQLVTIKDDAQKAITNGRLFGRVEPYLTLIKEINQELVNRIKDN